MLVGVLQFLSFGAHEQLDRKVAMDASHFFG